MSAYISVEERNKVFAELKGQLYRKFRKENISVEWCLKTEKLLTYAISKSRTQKDIDTLRDIILAKVSKEEKITAEKVMKLSGKKDVLKEKLGKTYEFMKKPLGQQGGYGDVVLLGSVTLYTTVLGIATLLSEMIK